MNSTTETKSAKNLVIIDESFAFGRTKWIRYIGDPGEAPPLPSNIRQLLEAPCPFWPDKSVKQTHVLTLIPKTVTRIIDNNPVTVDLTLKTFENLVKNPISGQAVSYRPSVHQGVYSDRVLQLCGDIGVKESHWILMTKDVIPESRSKIATEQEQLLQKGKHDAPSFLDATVSILLNQTKCSFNKSTFTVCTEKIKGGRVVVGGLNEQGLLISYIISTSYIIGTAAVLKLPVEIPTRQN